MNNPIDGLRICRADYGCQSHSLALVTLLFKSIVEWRFEREQKAAALLPPENPQQQILVSPV